MKYVYKYIYVCEVWCESHSVMSDSLWPYGWHRPWNSPGQNTGVGNLSLLQEIFPTQGSNRGLLHCRQILYQLSHKKSRRILKWIAYPFSSGSSLPRNRTGVSYIAGRFFTNWAMGEAYICTYTQTHTHRDSFLFERWIHISQFSACSDFMTYNCGK